MYDVFSDFVNKMSCFLSQNSDISLDKANILDVRGPKKMSSSMYVIAVAVSDDGCV